MRCKPRANHVARSRRHIRLSSPAQAGDPVFQRRQWWTDKPRRTGSSACAEDDELCVGLLPQPHCEERSDEAPQHATVILRAGGGSSTPRLLGSIIDVSGIRGPPPSRRTTTEYEFAISRRMCVRGLPFIPALQSEGAGKTGCAPHPRSRVPICAVAKAAHEHTGSAEASRPSLRNGFTAYFVLFPENGSFASVAGRTLSPLADLTPAPRRQNHTTSPYA